MLDLGLKTRGQDAQLALNDCGGNRHLAMQAQRGADAQPGTPKEFGILIKSEIDRWSHLIKDNNIQVE